MVPKGLFTAGFLARLLHEKYVLGRPVHRVVSALAAEGLEVAPGTLAGELRQVAPLLAPWAQAIAAHGRQAGHAHCDETSWQVFEDVADKENHRWWLWVFVTPDTTVFVMDPSRSARVAAGQLGIDLDQTALEAGRRLVISSDFHRAYQSLARIDGVDALWCFAHIRRYFLRAGAAHPDQLGQWCAAWTERIAVLYRAHHALAAAIPGTGAHEQALQRYQRAFTSLDAARIQQAGLAADGLLHPAAARVIATLASEWDGLARHQDLPQLPLDNNVAERALRNSVIGRKNFYGSGARWAADLAADVWTITATAARNDLEPLPLLQDYLTACAQPAAPRPPERTWNPSCPGHPRDAPAAPFPPAPGAVQARNPRNLVSRYSAPSPNDGEGTVATLAIRNVTAHGFTDYLPPMMFWKSAPGSALSREHFRNPRASQLSNLINGSSGFSARTCRMRKCC